MSGKKKETGHLIKIIFAVLCMQLPFSVIKVLLILLFLSCTMHFHFHMHTGTPVKDAMEGCDLVVWVSMEIL